MAGLEPTNTRLRDEVTVSVTTQKLNFAWLGDFPTDESIVA